LPSFSDGLSPCYAHLVPEYLLLSRSNFRSPSHSLSPQPLVADPLNPSSWCQSLVTHPAKGSAHWESAFRQHPSFSPSSLSPKITNRTSTYRQPSIATSRFPLLMFECVGRPGALERLHYSHLIQPELRRSIPHFLAPLVKIGAPHCMT
jgi:hypothetical protein